MKLLTEKVRQWLDIRANENVAIDIPELCKLILGDADGLTRDAERYRFVRACKGVAIGAKEARDPIAYDAAIDATMLKSVEQAIIDISSFAQDRDLKMKAQPTKLVVRGEWLAEALAVLKKARRDTLKKK